MRQYANQSFFKSLCKANYLAYEEVRRLNKLNQEETSEKLNWIMRMAATYNIIAHTLKDMIDNKQSIIVTSKEEVMALIVFYNENTIAGNGVVNLDKMYMDVYPKDKISQRFLQAYKDMNNYEIYKMYEKMYDIELTVKWLE